MERLNLTFLRHSLNLGESRLCFHAEKYGHNPDKPFSKVPERPATNEAALAANTKEKWEALNKQIERAEDDVGMINLFMHYPDILSKDTIDAKITKEHGALELLSKIDVKKRQEKFMECLDRYIPQEQQAKMGIHMIPNETPDQRFAKITPQLTKVSSVLGAMIDAEGWDKGFDSNNLNDVIQIARDSLTHHYKNPDLLPPEEVNKNMDIDLAKAMGYGALTKNFRLASTDPEAVMKNLGESRIRAALRLGVVGEEDLALMKKDFSDDEYMRNILKSDVVAHLNDITEAKKIEQRIEAKGFRDMWDGMNGIQKLAIAAGSIYLLTRKGFVGFLAKLGAVGAVGTYLYQRLVLKDEDPLKSWEKTINGFSGTKKKVSKEKPESAADLDDITHKASAMVDFLEPHDLQNIETSATGFGLLSRMPLNMLAQHFYIATDGTGDLDYGSKTFQHEMNKQMEESGWKRSSYKGFFENPRNAEEVNQAMEYVFYTIAADDPKNADQMRLVEEVRGQLPRDFSFSKLDRFDFSRVNPEFQEMIFAAREAYLRLMADGKRKAESNPQRLQEYVWESLNRHPVTIELPGKKPEKTTIYSGGMPDEGTIDPGNNPPEGTVDPGNNPPEGTIDPGVKSQDSNLDPGVNPQQTQSDKGLVPNEGVSAKGKEASDTEPEKGKEPMEKPTN